MDLKQLNAILHPFNIEVTCDGCSAAVRAGLAQSPPSKAFQSFPKSAETEGYNLPREEKKPSRKKTIQKVTKNPPGSTYRQTHSESFGNPRPKAPPAPPQETGHSFRNWQGAPQNPPNHILNLNIIDPRTAKKPDIHTILEDSMKTPHKIGDVNIDHLMFSDRKRLSARHNQTGSTFDPSFDLEDFPEHPPTNFDGVQDTPLNHKMAFSGIPSKAASPCYTPVRFVVATPGSRAIKTPASALSVSPVPRFSVNFDGLRKKNSDFPMNLFYDAL
jgi:hypothetical protein